MRALLAGLMVIVASIATAIAQPADVQLAAAQAQIAKMVADGRAVLAGHADPHGNWTFANAKGERFSAATPDEMKRVAGVLAPGAEPAKAPIYVLTPDTVFADAGAWRSLPATADLRIASSGAVYRLLKTIAGGLQVEVRPALAIAAKDRTGFDAALWYFNRPFEKARMRIVAMEGGGPRVLSSTPRIDPATKEALIDPIEPAALVDAIKGLKGQTAVLSGRTEGEFLVGFDSRGRAQRVALGPLFDAAIAADTGVIVLGQTNPAQMGGRNWAYQKIEARGLADAASRATFGDFFEALAAGERFIATPRTAADGRIVIDVARSGLGAPTEIGSRVGRVLKDLASQAMGKVPVVGMTVVLPPLARQQSLDGRWFGALPRSWVWIYAGLFVLGLIGWPVADRWFSRVWPQEQAGEYHNAFGYAAARAIRTTLLALVYAPAVAVASAPVRVMEMVGRGRASV